MRAYLRGAGFCDLTSAVVVAGCCRDDAPLERSVASGGVAPRVSRLVVSGGARAIRSWSMSAGTYAPVLH